MPEPTVTVELEIPESMIRSLQRLSGKRMVDTDVLARLALFDFLVKFNSYKGDASEREHYQFLYDHFAIPPEERVMQKARRDVEKVLSDSAF
jgi:hypothetical protein